MHVRETPRPKALRAVTGLAPGEMLPGGESVSVRGRPRQNCRAQPLSRPVSHHALSLTRSFQVPFAGSAEASTV